MVTRAEHAPDGGGPESPDPSPVATGVPSGRIVHDLNNILTAIRGYAELARTGLEPGHPAGDDLDHVISAADRATELVRQLLASSRGQVLEHRDE